MLPESAAPDAAVKVEARPGNPGRPVSRGAAAFPDIVPRARAARSAAEAARGRARQLQEQARHVLARGEALHPVIETALADRMLGRPPAARQHLLRRSEYARLVARLDTMPVIEQAKGIIMAQQRSGPDEAFDLLRRASQRMNVPVRELAAQIVAKMTGAPAKPGDNTGRAA